MPHTVVPRVLLSCLLIGTAFPGFAHEAGRVPLIVDTDVALDDARAVAVLARAPGVELLALLTSDGGSSPCEGAARMHRLLAALGRPGVSVGPGQAVPGPTPPWREVAGLLDELQRGDVPPCESLPGAVELAREALDGAAGPVTWVALGPLTNLAALLRRHPEAVERLGAVYYGGDAPDAERPGWNSSRDPEAAAAVFAADLPLRLVDSRGGGAGLTYDAALLGVLADLDSPAASWISRLHSDARVARLVADGHAGAWDDAVALALLAPEAFAASQAGEGAPLVRLVPAAPDSARGALLRVLAADDSLAPRPGVVLSELPTDPAALRDDVAEVAERILARHGAEEWKAALLASELHRHIGIYSLVGVKMGIRARELLGASLDDLEVVSHAGTTPPLSCLSDGLQAATGASLGRGTIRVGEGRPLAEADFVGDGQRLRLTLKAGVWNRIQGDVAAAVERFGPAGPRYFAEIRRLSIAYWLELDRHDIFDAATDTVEAAD